MPGSYAYSCIQFRWFKAVSIYTYIYVAVRCVQMWQMPRFGSFYYLKFKKGNNRQN